MLEVIEQTTQIARKRYSDDGCEWVREGIVYRVWEFDQFGNSNPKKHRPTISEYRTLVSFKNDPNCQVILPGQEYVKERQKYDGDFRTFRMKKDIYHIAMKYKFFAED